MKKTVISIFLVAVMLVSFILPASAESGKLSANATFAEDKTTFTVNLVVENNPGFIAVTAEAAYDSKVLTLKSANNGEIFESILTPSPTLESNPYKIIWMNAIAEEDIKTNGILASYTFEVKKDVAAEQTEIKFNIVETVNVKNEDTVSFTPCTFNVDLKNTVGESKVESKLPVSSSADTIGSGVKDAVSSDKAPESQVSSKVEASSEVEAVTPETDKEVVSSNVSEQPEADKEVISSNVSEQPEADKEVVSSNVSEQQDSATNDVDSASTDRTLVTVLTIAAILVLGGIVTFIAIYFRKKSSAKNEEK